MSWNIDLIVNTVVINAKIAKALFDSKTDIADIWQQCFDCCDEEVVTDQPITGKQLLNNIVGYKKNDGKYYLNFDDDHREHMDYVEDKTIQKILKKHKVKGDICFSSNEGDNAGSLWGYRFYEDGTMTKLVGSVNWTEVTPSKKKKAKKQLVCASCYDGVTLNDHDELAGTDITTVGAPELYCYDCGFSHLKEI